MSVVYVTKVNAYGLLKFPEGERRNGPNGYLLHILVFIVKPSILCQHVTCAFDRWSSRFKGVADEIVVRDGIFR